MFGLKKGTTRKIGLRLMIGLVAGVLFGGLATRWQPAYLFKGALVGVMFLLPTEIGTRCFRSWSLAGERYTNPEREGMRFAFKLLVIWATEVLLVIPVIHWTLGVPVLLRFNSVLPFASCSLAWVAITLISDTATRLYRTGGELARSEARAEFLALKAQLQPHTLFNALNGIIGLIPENPRDAEEATRRLASLMRHLLEGLDRTHWTLADEFEVIEDLLQVETLRFGDRLDTRVLLDPSMGSRRVPPLCILPLVENSLRHGFRGKVGSCSLCITASEGVVSVRDNGTGFGASWREGVGLRIVRERIEAEGGKVFFPDTSDGAFVKVSL